MLWFIHWFFTNHTWVWQRNPHSPKVKKIRSKFEQITTNLTFPMEIYQTFKESKFLKKKGFLSLVDSTSWSTNGDNMEEKSCASVKDSSIPCQHYQILLMLNLVSSTTWLEDLHVVHILSGIFNSLNKSLGLKKSKNVGMDARNIVCWISPLIRCVWVIGQFSFTRTSSLYRWVLSTRTSVFQVMHGSHVRPTSYPTPFSSTTPYVEYIPSFCLCLFK